MIHHTPTNEWISQSKSKKPDTCPCNQEQKSLEKYESIQNKTSNIIGKNIDKKTIHRGQHLNTKLKSYQNRLSRQKTPKEKPHCFCLAAILLVSGSKKNKDNKYYPQICLEQSQYQVKNVEKKKRYIKGKIVISASDECDEKYDVSTE